MIINFSEAGDEIIEEVIGPMPKQTVHLTKKEFGKVLFYHILFFIIPSTDLTS